MPLPNFLVFLIILIITEARPYSDKREIVCDKDCPFPCTLTTSVRLQDKEKFGICSEDPTINFKTNCFNPELFKCDDHVQCPETYKCCETSFVPFKVCKLIRTEKTKNSITFELEKSKIVYTTGDEQTLFSAFISNSQYNLTVNNLTKNNNDLVGNIEKTLEILNDFQNGGESGLENWKNNTDTDRLLIRIPIPDGEMQKNNFTENTDIFVTNTIPTIINPDDYSGSGNYESDDEDYHLIKDLTTFDYIY